MCDLIPYINPFSSTQFLNQRYRINAQHKPTDHVQQFQQIQNLLLFTSPSYAKNYSSIKPVFLHPNISTLHTSIDQRILKQTIQLASPQIYQYLLFLVSQYNQSVMVLYRFEESIKPLKQWIQSSNPLLSLKTYNQFLAVVSFQGVVLILEPFLRQEANFVKILSNKLSSIGTQVQFLSIIPQKLSYNYIYPDIVVQTKTEKYKKQTRPKRNITVYFDIDNKNKEANEIEIDLSTQDQLSTEKHQKMVAIHQKQKSIIDHHLNCQQPKQPIHIIDLQQSEGNFEHIKYEAKQMDKEVVCAQYVKQNELEQSIEKTFINEIGPNQNVKSQNMLQNGGIQEKVFLQTRTSESEHQNQNGSHHDAINESDPPVQHFNKSPIKQIQQQPTKLRLFSSFNIFQTIHCPMKQTKKRQSRCNQ